MNIVERQRGDVEQLEQLVRNEKDAQQRDRYRVVVLAIAQCPTKDIQRTLHRSRGFVQRWAYAYRDGGIDAIAARTPPGAEPKLSVWELEAFKQRMEGGPTDTDGGVCTLRGKDALRILEEQFGQSYSLPGVYAMMHRMGLSCLKPRPRHRKNDPLAMASWQADAPLLSSK